MRTTEAEPVVAGRDGGGECSSPSARPAWINVYSVFVATVFLLFWCMISMLSLISDHPQNLERDLDNLKPSTFPDDLGVFYGGAIAGACVEPACLFVQAYLTHQCCVE